MDASAASSTGPRRRQAWFCAGLRPARACSARGAPACPPSGSTSSPCRRPGGAARRDPLWLRFCARLGIDPAWAPRDSERANASLGVAETQVLRQLNRRLDRAARREATYDELIREHARPGGAGPAAAHAPVHAAAATPTTGSRSRPSAGSSGSRAAASTSSATSTTCGPCGPPPTPTWHDPDRVRPQASARRRARRAGRDDPRGRAPPRPRPTRWPAGRQARAAARR